MISIIITSFGELNTIKKAVDSFVNQGIKDYEVIIVSPNKEIKDMFNDKRIIHILDEGKGKPAALNLAFKKAKGDILILSDGDVFVSNNSVKYLLNKFKNNVGAVTGRPVSLNKKNNKFDYWSHLLVNAAHVTRKIREGNFIICSGYLFAIRKGIVKEIPEDVLSDDAIISNLIWKAGYKIDYADKALVYVKYPDNFKDWIKQKKRSAGGYNQIKKYVGSDDGMRSFWKEVIFGWKLALLYPKNIKEFYWTLLLFLARLYLWFKIFIDLNIKKESFEKVWERVESTK